MSNLVAARRVFFSVCAGGCLALGALAANVALADGPPAGYTAVGWISSDGSEHIDTGAYASKSICAEMDFEQIQYTLKSVLL